MNLYLLVATLSVATATDPTCASVAAGSRIDCGIVGSTQQTCEASGCCWQPDNSGGKPHLAKGGLLFGHKSLRSRLDDFFVVFLFAPMCVVVFWFLTPAHRCV
jgi:hypothetical protein